MRHATRTAIALLAFSLVFPVVAAAQDTRPGADVSGVGPRGPVGPDVPLPDVDKTRFADRVTAEARTAEAVQKACRDASKRHVRTVFLPAGVYVFDKQVGVPAGVTLLGEGSKTLCQAKGNSVRLFDVQGDGVRFTRLKLQGADTTPGASNDTHGIDVSGKQDLRIDHCELLGFSYAMDFGGEATAQVDHCFIHYNLRDGLGYGVAVYSGAYVLVTDNEFGQNRHSLASNGALDWSSPKRVGKYLHKPGVRKTHWEFIHNRVGSNDRSPYELCAVDAHPGMDGTFVVEANLFEGLRHGVGIRDGSGLIQGNVFRDLRTVTRFRPLVGVSISYDKHNNVPVEGCMPHDIQVRQNVFLLKEGVQYEKCSLGKAQNIMIDGKLAPQTKADLPIAPPLPLLIPMGEEGKLGVGRRKPVSKPPPETKAATGNEGPPSPPIGCRQPSRNMSPGKVFTSYSPLYCLLPTALLLYVDMSTSRRPLPFAFDACQGAPKELVTRASTPKGFKQDEALRCQTALWGQRPSEAIPGRLGGVVREDVGRLAKRLQESIRKGSRKAADAVRAAPKDDKYVVNIY